MRKYYNRQLHVLNVDLAKKRQCLLMHVSFFMSVLVVVQF
jgi:hypothetical protein